jgi:hypothetical protein
MKDLMHAGMAIKRHGEPEEIAGMVAYLAGAGSGIVTGAQHHHRRRFRRLKLRSLHDNCTKSAKGCTAMTSLRLISHRLCHYVQRAAIILAEKGDTFEREDIDLANKPDCS